MFKILKQYKENNNLKKLLEKIISNRFSIKEVTSERMLILSRLPKSIRLFENTKSCLEYLTVYKITVLDEYSGLTTEEMLRDNTLNGKYFSIDIEEFIEKYNS